MKNKYSYPRLYSSLIQSFRNVTYQCLFLTLIFIGSSSGSVESNIVCRLSNQNQTVFWTGEFVSGNIECTNSNKQKFKLKSINVEVVGLLVYKHLPKNKYGSSIRSIYKRFFNQTLNINSSNAQDGFLVPHDTHTWPFRFFLNDSLPPSFKPRKSTDSYISYSLQLVFVRPEWYRRNIKKAIFFDVKYASSPVDAKKEEAQGKNRKDVHLHIILQKPVVAVGKNISFDVKIQNPKQVSINRITVILAQHLKLGPAETRRIDFLNETLKTINQFKDPYFHETFQFHVPNTTPPTFEFHFPPSSKERPMIISYELLFEAHLSGIATNIRLQLPLIITDHPQNN